MSGLVENYPGMHGWIKHLQSKERSCMFVGMDSCDPKPFRKLRTRGVLTVYQDLLEDHVQDLWYRIGGDDKLATSERVIGKFSSTRIEKIFGEVMHTGFGQGLFHEVCELDAKGVFLSYPLRYSAPNKDLITYWGKKLEILGGGKYDPLNRKIFIKDDPPIAVDFLKSFLISGRMPTVSLLWLHELCHYHQFTVNGMPIYRDAQSFEIYRRTELEEAQSYRLGPYLTPVKSREELASHILEAKGGNGIKLYPEVKQDRLRTAIELIDLMNSLGIGSKRLAYLIINCGQWNPEARDYDLLRNVARYRMAKLGIDEDEIELIHQIDKVERCLGEFRLQNLVNDIVSRDADKAFTNNYEGPTLREAA